MTKTLVLLFHPNLSASTTNAAFAKAATTVEGVRVVDMQARYPDGVIDMFTDAEVEAQMLLDTDRIVLQFPLQWYATPVLLKAWQDAVLTRMYYINAATEGALLSGTPIMIAVTAGNVPDAYTPEGQNYYSIDALLTPLKATAYRCGLPWHAPYIIYNAGKLDPSALSAAADGYADALRAFIAATAPKSTSQAA
ncbi:NAD(P)H-dependent oxidoreductase [Loktanella sp. M215]|uniref:NAD(P)H-dependent oxidoreductase n=1 Tax=Loktanella sp. M215 TaxID=2675431 RepID=UPI001F29F3B9|nr:NAD(P)H-dependent oxidoreductase [Loktanella sp. M215]MCF7702417.1 flavodoxin family protein [Loktanella sp. M215]